MSLGVAGVGCLTFGSGNALATPRHVRPKLPSATLPQIVGGSDATSEAFPWMAFVISRTSSGTSLCSGTVISSNLVLTAGHCVYDVEAGSLNPASSYAVITGASDWTDTSSRQVSAVSQTFLAPGYDPSNGDHDAGLLELSTPTTAPAIPLATSSTYLYGGDGVAIAGWGLTDPSDPNSLATQLQWAPTVVQAPGYCAGQGVDERISFDADAQLCTIDGSYDDTSFCHGDSGGPVIANDLVGEPGTPTEIGVIDESASCSTDQAGFSARVDVIAPWAEELISSLAPSTHTPPPASVAAPSAPTSSLGLLSVTTGRRDARDVLSGVFGRHFSRGEAIRLRCSRASQTKVACSSTWSYGPNDYYGRVMIYLALQDDQVVWTDRYVIRSVNDYCYFDSGHRRRCRITRRAGTF